jgi:predicted nucleic acid-binding protein
MVANDRLFVDTGAWLAVIDPRDQYHAVARRFYRQAIEERARFLTTNLVVAEAYTLVRRRLGHRTSMRFLELIGLSHRLLKIWSTPELEESAEGILREYGDQGFSYVDAVSFAAMKDTGLHTVFAFDHHFEVMGFMRQPDLD